MQANPGATKLKSESSLTRGGILCCLGYRTASERFGLFATARSTGGMRLPVSHEPTTDGAIAATMK
ncbi:MAG: hypothetical protein NTU49_09690 [Gammaproteobacteria bacterium]|nr:hypothetical protein [Gammaproteobacteria bacterium]